MVRTRRPLVVLSLILFMASALLASAHSFASRSGPISTAAQAPLLTAFYPGARDTTVAYPEANQTQVSGPYVLTAQNNILTFNHPNGPGEIFTVFHQCLTDPYPVRFPIPSWSGYTARGSCDDPGAQYDTNGVQHWVGNFQPDTHVIHVGDIEIAFANPVTEVGAQAQWWTYNRSGQGFRFYAYNRETELGYVDFSFSGLNTSSPAANDSAPFIGVRTSCGNVITRVKIISLGYQNPGNYALGPIKFGSISAVIPPIPPSP